MKTCPKCFDLIIVWVSCVSSVNALQWITSECGGPGIIPVSLKPQHLIRFGAQMFHMYEKTSIYLKCRGNFTRLATQNFKI